MNKIVETLQESQSLIESWGDVIDVTEFMTDTPGFFQANSLGVYTQIYDRADGRYRPVYTNESDLKIIRAMGWLLVERVPMAQAWINRLLDYTIGTGFDWTIKASDKRLEKAIQAYVRETLDNSKWSSELERESYAREVGEGECLIEHVYENGQCLAVACEADELTEPARKNELEDWIGIDYVPSWSFGVLTRENRPQNPIGYHFVRNATGTDWDYVTADRVSHWKRNVRSRAKRGFSDFYKPHLYLLRADRVLTNTAEGAATQAAIAYIVEHRDGQQRQAENIVKRFSAPTGRVDPMTGIMERKRKMKPGTRLDVPEGQTYKAGLLGANNSGIYIEVMEAALRLAGSVHAFVEGMLTGSYSNNNFASALVAEGPFMQGRLAEQSQRKERMREMILKMIRLGAGKRRFAAVGYESWDSIRDAITVEVIPSRIVPMDPLKTAQALAIQKQNGWVSDKTCINELGRDIDTETANGLKIGGAENQPGAGGQPGAQTNENTGAAVPDLGNVSKTEQEQGGEWLGITTVQWRRNRKAITDVLTDFARGKLKRNVAKVLLRSIGIPDRGIETILDDASDGQIDSMPQMESLTEAERKTLNKPFRTSGGPKKFSVYVKNQKGNVVKVNFGDPKMRIKRDDPGSRRNFRARHNCDSPGPKWKAKYWSCRMWSKPSVTKILKESLETGEIGWDGRTFVRESWLYRQNPRLLEVRDGDGDGKINDGKPSEAPAPPKEKTNSSTKTFKTGLEHGFAEMLGSTKRGVKTIGPIDIRGFRVGDTERAGKKVVHFGGTEKDAEAYQSMHIDAGSANTEIKPYDISFRNAVLAGHQNDLTSEWFNKRYGEMMDSYQRKYGAKYGAAYATAKFDEKLSAEAKKRGYDGIILIAPAPPAKIEYWDVGGKTSTFEVAQSKQESLQEAKDGDGDGKINDGKPSEAPAEKKDKKRSAAKKANATVNPKVLEWAKKKFKDDAKAKNFAEWFGDSKVVDADGNPLVVYKAMYGYDADLGPSKNWKGEITKPAQPGFDNPLEVIKRKSKFPSFDKADPEGVEIAGFFGSQEIANKFANNPNAGMDSIYPVFLKIEKPYVIDAKGEPAGKFQFGQTGKPFRDAIRSNKYDGVIIENTADEGTIHVALQANQIKSATGNKGTFNPKSNKINESLQEAKDGDGDGLIDDGKPTQRAAPPKEPKAKKEVPATKPQKDEAGYKSKFESLKTEHEAIRDQIQAANKKLKGSKTHEETVEAAKALQDLESQKYALAWNSATEYGSFHAENESEYRRLRGTQLDDRQKNQDEKNKLLIEWANEVKMRPRTDVTFFTLSMGADAYDEDKFHEKISASYTVNNSLETIKKYKGKFQAIGEKKDFSAEINQAYYGEPIEISSEAIGDGAVSVPSKVSRGGADPSMKKFMETAAVAIQVDPKLLSSIAEKGVLSYSEGGKKGVASKLTSSNRKGYLEIRQKTENDLFGLSDSDRRPVYGLIDNPARIKSGSLYAAGNYGAAQVILKPSIKSRTSYTIGDSLDDKHYGGKAGAVNDPSDHSSVISNAYYRSEADAAKNPSSTIAGESKNQFKVIVRSDGGTREKTQVPNYIEAQIHGGVQPSDIQEVRVPRGQIAPAAKKKFEKAGISVVEIPPPPVENFYNVVPTWETVGND